MNNRKIRDTGASPDERKHFSRKLEREKEMEEFRIDGEKRHREMREDLEVMERHIEESRRILDELKRSLYPASASSSRR